MRWLPRKRPLRSPDGALAGSVRWAQVALVRDFRSEVMWYLEEHHADRAELAERLGISPQAFRVWLHGENLLDLTAIATAAGASVRVVAEDPAAAEEA